MSSQKYMNGSGVEIEEDANIRNMKMDLLLNNLPPTKTSQGKESTVHLGKLGNLENPYTYEVLNESAQYILKRTDLRPKVAIICGSGLGSIVNGLDSRHDFPYEEIPHFPSSTVPGHAGQLVVGKMGKIPVVCMQGRFHYYEGYPLWKCAMPVRVFKLLGVEMLVVTNAAGGLNPSYRVGDIMMLKDHVNFPGFGGESALRGPNDDKFGPRFIALNKAYDIDLRKLGKKVAAECGMQDFFHEGVYTMVGGPSFETVSELRLMKMLGIDAVGMSTVPEVTVARHCGIRCFGFSLITNECILEYDADDEANHEEVMEAAAKRKDDLVRFTQSFVAAAADQLNLDAN